MVDNVCWACLCRIPEEKAEEWKMEKEKKENSNCGELAYIL